MADEVTPQDGEVSLAESSTSDLENELLRRQKRKERGWTLAIASSLAAAITSWIPNISGWIDAQAERTRHLALIDKVAVEEVSNDEAYSTVANKINSHADALDDLQTDVTVLLEWKKSVEERLRPLNIRVPPVEVAAPADLEALEKISTDRPKPDESDPKLKRAKIDLREGTVYEK